MVFNRITSERKMQYVWKKSYLVPIYNNKRDVQACRNYRGIKLISHATKKKVVEKSLKETTVSENPVGFMPERSTSEPIICVR